MRLPKSIQTSHIRKLHKIDCFFAKGYLCTLNVTAQIVISRAAHNDIMTINMMYFEGLNKNYVNSPTSLAVDATQDKDISTLCGNSTTYFKLISNVFWALISFFHSTWFLSVNLTGGLGMTSFLCFGTGMLGSIKLT